MNKRRTTPGNQILRLLGPDPFLRGMWRIFRSFGQAYWSVCLILLLYYLTLGISLSLIYGSQVVVPIWETAELFNGIPVFLITIPFVLAMCFWQPYMLDYLLDALERKRIITEKQADSLLNTPTLRELLEHRLNTRRLSIFALLIGSLTTLVFFIFAVPQEQLSFSGRIAFLYIHPVGYISFAFIFFIALYALALYIGRNLIVVDCFFEFFGRPQSIKTIYPFDPDKGGGLAVVSQYSIFISRIAVVTAIQCFTFVIHPAIGGGTYNMLVGIAVAFFYILLAPFSTFLPLWPVHNAMVAYRNVQLHKIAQELHASLHEVMDTANHDAADQAATLRFNAVSERLKHLKEHYDFIQTYMPTWPGGFAVVRFSFTATLPAVVSGITSGVQLYQSLIP